MNDQLDFSSPAPSSAPNTASDVREDEFIQEMLRRQDSVLEQLDELNLRVEAAIKEISKARQQSDELVADEAAGQPAEEQILPPVLKAA